MNTKQFKGIGNFTCHRVDSHRNGISGRSFSTVHFAFDAEDCDPPRRHERMMAIVPDGARVDGSDVEVFIVDLDEPDQRWRGDSFLPFIVDALGAHEKR